MESHAVTVLQRPHEPLDFADVLEHRFPLGAEVVIVLAEQMLEFVLERFLEGRLNCHELIEPICSLLIGWFALEHSVLGSGLVDASLEDLNEELMHFFHRVSELQRVLVDLEIDQCLLHRLADAWQQHKFVDVHGLHRRL